MLSITQIALSSYNSKIRWGKGTEQRHGGFYSGPDKFKPGHKLDHKFEDAFTVDKWSWGYRRYINIENVLSIEELIATIAEIVSCNGNVLVNVGPTKEGTICPIFQERMIQMGQWLSVNGEAIYKTRPFLYQNDSLSPLDNGPQVWYTMNSNYVYATALGWPKNGLLTLGDIKLSSTSKVQLLGYNKPLKTIEFEVTNAAQLDSVTIQFPPLDKFIEQCGKQCLPAFSLKFSQASPRVTPRSLPQVIVS